MDFYGRIRNTIEENIEVIPEENRPKVYCESRLYRSAGEGTGWNQKVTLSGGNNILGDLEGYFDVDPEEVIKRDPEIIVKGPSWGTGGYTTDDITELSDMYNEVIERPELTNVTAVRNNRIYVIANDIFGGIKGNFVGMAYLSKWFYPDLFEDFDPQAIHQEYLTEFQGLDYNLDEHGVFIYPEAE
ncbi:MAG: ABC transporter substrate-binding protein [Euryarchaeota archaeon]|nr:ABC transporter substrate-binding protein [Euryarchaeota archaeon]